MHRYMPGDPWLYGFAAFAIGTLLIRLIRHGDLPMPERTRPWWVSLTVSGIVAFALWLIGLASRPLLGDMGIAISFTGGGALVFWASVARAWWFWELPGVMEGRWWYGERIAQVVYGTMGLVMAALGIVILLRTPAA